VGERRLVRAEGRAAATAPARRLCKRTLILCERLLAVAARLDAERGAQPRRARDLSRERAHNVLFAEIAVQIRQLKSHLAVDARACGARVAACATSTARVGVA
tara:strand:- start:465 stop:773 length:309 start_codon:yes stop_codon:yes gene_type:complete